MENINRIKKTYKATINFNGTQVPLTFSESSKKLIQACIDNGTPCICAYNSMEEYRYSTIGSKFSQINIADTVGKIASINYDTREVEIDLISDCSNPNSYRYISPDDYDKYIISIRGLYSRVAGDPVPDEPDIIFIGFDLIKR